MRGTIKRTHPHHIATQTHACVIFIFFFNLRQSHRWILFVLLIYWITAFCVEANTDTDTCWRRDNVKHWLNGSESTWEHHLIKWRWWIIIIHRFDALCTIRVVTGYGIWCSVVLVLLTAELINLPPGNVWVYMIAASSTFEADAVRHHWLHAPAPRTWTPP